MKKSTILWLSFIIVAIIAMFTMSSFMGGLGFALSIVIMIYALMCIVGAIYLIYSAYENIKCKDILSAIGNVIMFGILLFLGIKILIWLIGVLM